MLNIVKITIFLMSVTYSSTAVVKWLPNKSFHLPINFSNRKLPCSKETVIFPDVLEETVKMDGETSVRGFVLPTDGTLVLNSGVIEFGADDSDTNCTEGNVFYAHKTKALWNDPDVWTSSRFNEATPDTERMPCFDDIVEFPDDAQFTVMLPPDGPVQFLKEIKVRGKTYTHHWQVDGFFNLEGQVFNNFFPWTLQFVSSYCKAVAGCQCQKQHLRVNCEAKQCQKPKCVAPIKPLGHCCLICGGELIFKTTESFNFNHFKEFVGKTIDTYRSNHLAYHVGKISDGRVQVVVVNKGDYDGTSSEVLNLISHTMENHWLQGSVLEAVSGSPLSKAGLGGKIAVSMFFAVIIAMAGVYVYYYRLPSISIGIPIMRRDPRTTISRFHRRSDSVVSLTSRRDYNVATEDLSATAFRNPLYDSKRGRAEVAE